MSYSSCFRDQKHVEWARTLIKIINDLQEYVKQNHTPSLKWNREVGMDIWIYNLPVTWLFVS